MRIKQTLLALAATAALVVIAPAVAPAQTDRAELEDKLHVTLQGARLVGQFSVVGADGAVARPPQADQYAVSRLERDAEGRWIFNVSMSYGTQQHTMPVPVTIEWAGDTPMITMTEQTIEGLGTFTARVLLYEGLYAGTWKHGQFGGHMWGRIESGGSIPAPMPTPAAPAAAPPAVPPTEP
jgi:hypothetical protein